MLKIKTLKGQIYVSGDTYPIKDHFKSMPATRWHKASKSYVMPATVGAARNLQAVIRHYGIRCIADEGTKILGNFVRSQDAAQAVKQHSCTADCIAWHHQTEAIKFIENQPSAILNMPTGTGKTKTTIDLIMKRGHQLVLVITKKKAVSVWKKDVIKFLGTDAINVIPLDTGSVKKNAALAQEALHSDKPVILVTNYQSVWRNPFKSWLLKQSIDLVVLDEGHMIKAPGSKASMFLKRLRKNVPSLVELTATFWGDKPVDVYAQMRTVDIAVLGSSFAAFKDEYCYMGGVTGKEILGYKNQEQLAEKLAPYIFAVDKAVLKLIPVREKRYYCTLKPEMMKLYKTFSAEGFVRLDEDRVVSADNILVKLLKSQQMACGFTKADDTEDIVRLDSSKLDTLTEILINLPELEGCLPHAPVVVYCRFKEDLKGIKAVAEKLGYAYGEISGAIDQQEDFKNGTVNLLGCQIDAGGTGVDGLQEVCNIAIYYSTGHSLIQYVQSLGRLDRPGQTKSVLNLYIVAENTVDEDIVQALQNKEDVIKYLQEKVKEYGQV